MCVVALIQRPTGLADGLAPDDGATGVPPAGPVARGPIRPNVATTVVPPSPANMVAGARLTGGHTNTPTGRNILAVLSAGEMSATSGVHHRSCSRCGGQGLAQPPTVRRGLSSRSAPSPRPIAASSLEEEPGAGGSASRIRSCPNPLRARAPVRGDMRGVRRHVRRLRRAAVAVQPGRPLPFGTNSLVEPSVAQTHRITTAGSPAARVAVTRATMASLWARLFDSSGHHCRFGRKALAALQASNGGRPPFRHVPRKSHAVPETPSGR